MNTYNKDGDIGYLFHVDLELKPEHHIGLEEMYPSIFERELCDLSVLSPYQILHKRRFSKLKSKMFNKATFAAKNMGTMFAKKKIWLTMDALQLACGAGWEITKGHRYFTYLQDYIMKQYIEENQQRRMKATNAVELQLWKDANNKAFGGQTQRITDRIKITPIIDKVSEMAKLINRNDNYFQTAQ